MSDKDKSEINKVHEVARGEARLDQDIAVQSSMGHEDVANAYARRGTGTQTVALNNASSSSNEGKKTSDLLLFLDTIEKLEAVARENLQNLQELQSDMRTIVGDVDEGIKKAKAHERNINDYLEAYKNRDVDRMERLMLESGLYVQEEVDAMFQDGSSVPFVLEYENFVQEAISDFDSVVQVLTDYKEEYDAKADQFNQELESLNEKIEQAKNAGFGELADELNEQKTGLLVDFGELDTVFQQKVADLQNFISPEELEIALKELVNNANKQEEFVRVNSNQIDLSNQYNVVSGAAALQKPETQIEQTMNKPTVATPAPGFGGL